MCLGVLGDETRQRGLAGAGRTRKDDGREKPVRDNGAAQQLALTDDVVLADEFIQRARA